MFFLTFFQIFVYFCNHLILVTFKEYIYVIRDSRKTAQKI